jgi:hypothetical protein
MTYLSRDHLMQALARGHRVEQWLGTEAHESERLIKWVCIEKEPQPDGTYSVVLKKAYDEGGPLLHRLPVLDVDEPEGEISSFETKEEALDYIINELNGMQDRFLREGEIQQEYEKYLSTRSA